MADKNERAIKVVAENRKARFNYAIEDTIEAGRASCCCTRSRSTA
jgi:SsrA-binding protein